MSQFHNNGVLTGQLEHYCLVCEETFLCADLLGAHIQRSEHQEKLNKTCFSEKHFVDKIRKVARGYYCQYCNVLLKNKIKVNFHVDEEDHVANKTEGATDHNIGVNLKRVGDGVLLFDNLLLSIAAWNAIIDNCCALCAVDVDVKEEHQKSSEHIINLIQNDTKTDINNNPFRKLDNATFQCLICNIVLPDGKFWQHFENVDHKKCRQQCRKAKLEMTALNKKIEAVTKKKKQTDLTYAEKENINADGVNEPKGTLDNQNERNTDVQTDNNIKTVTQIQKHENIVKSPYKEKSKLGFNITRDVIDDQKDIKNEQYSIDKHCILRKEDKYYCIMCDLMIPKDEINTHVQSEVSCSQKHNTKKSSSSTKKSSSNAKKSSSNTLKKVNNNGSLKDNDTLRQEFRNILENLQNKVKCQKCNQYIESDMKNVSEPVNETGKGNDNNKKPNAKSNPIIEDVANSSRSANKNICASCASADRRTEIQKDVKAEASKQNNEHNIKNENMSRIHEIVQKNQIIYNGMAHSFCRVCELTIPSSLAIEKHCTELKHCRSLEAYMKKNPCNSAVKANYKTTKLFDFMKFVTLFKLKGPSTLLLKYVLINDSYCINQSSFLTFTPVLTWNLWHCQTCDEAYYHDKMHLHINSPSHNNKIRETPVLLLENEFVREIRLNLFHCGYCNLVESGWEKLQTHLKSLEHGEERANAMLLVEKYRSQMKNQHVARNQRERMFIDMQTLLQQFNIFK